MTSWNETMELTELRSSSIDPSTSQLWKMNLTASYKDMFFVALGDRIKCFRIHHLSQDFINTLDPEKDLSSYTETLFSWKISTGRRLQTDQETFINNIKTGYLKNTPVLVSVDELGGVNIWNIDKPNLSPKFYYTNDSAWGVAINRKRSLIAASSNSHQIHIFDTNTDNVLTLVGHTNNIPCVDFSENGLILSSCSIDGTCRIWEVNSGNCLSSFEITSSWGWSTTFLGSQPFYKSELEPQNRKPLPLIQPNSDKILLLLKAFFESRGAELFPYLKKFIPDYSESTTPNNEYPQPLQEVFETVSKLSVSPQWAIVNLITELNKIQYPNIRSNPPISDNLMRSLDPSFIMRYIPTILQDMELFNPSENEPSSDSSKDSILGHFTENQNQNLDQSIISNFLNFKNTMNDQNFEYNFEKNLDKGYSKQIWKSTGSYNHSTNHFFYTYDYQENRRIERAHYNSGSIFSYDPEFSNYRRLSGTLGHIPPLIINNLQISDQSDSPSSTETHEELESNPASDSSPIEVSRSPPKTRRAKETLESKRVKDTAQSPTNSHIPTSQKNPTYLDHLLLTSEADIYLIKLNYTTIDSSVVITDQCQLHGLGDPIIDPRYDHLLRGVGRLNMVQFVKQMNLIFVANQKGQVGIFRLYDVGKKQEKRIFMEGTLPADFNLLPDYPLLGFFINLKQSSHRLLDELIISLVYKNGKILRFNLRRFLNDNQIWTDLIDD